LRGGERRVRRGLGFLRRRQRGLRVGEVLLRRGERRVRVVERLLGIRDRGLVGGRERIGECVAVGEIIGAGGRSGGEQQGEGQEEDLRLHRAVHRQPPSSVETTCGLATFSCCGLRRRRRGAGAPGGDFFSLPR